MSKNGMPLQENQYVAELFAILRDNGKDTSGLSALIGNVNEMEKYIKRAEDAISGMKSLLSEIKEVKDHPFKQHLQNGIKNQERKITAIKERLTELKSDIVEGCKKAVTAFKEKGAKALNNIVSFFGVKEGLKDWKKDVESGIHSNDKTIDKITSFANEYHSAGKAVRNMARIAVGKQTVDTQKEAGKLAKTVAAPYKAQNAALTGLINTIDKAVKGLERLEDRASAKKETRAADEKPSILGQLKENSARVMLQNLEAHVQSNKKSKGVEI